MSYMRFLFLAFPRRNQRRTQVHEAHGGNSGKIYETVIFRYDNAITLAPHRVRRGRERVGHINVDILWLDLQKVSFLAASKIGKL